MNILKKTTPVWLCVAFFICGFQATANNIIVSNVNITGQNPVDDFSMITFDVSWENSWRTSTLESNWDAAWIFVKFRLSGNIDWFHASLNNIGHAAPVGSVIAPGLVNTTLPFHPSTNPVAGVFLHRSADGIGPVNFTNVQLRWNYGANGLADDATVEICVFAIEMVFIPQGTFWLGDNTNGTSVSSGHFIAGNQPTPFQVTSEAAITIGNLAPTELWGSSTTGNNTIGSAGTLPADFPKGFRGFYIMKYELSQLMYKEFLNRLTRTQQAARVSTTILYNYMSTVTTTTAPLNRNGIRLLSDPGGTFLRIYGNDLNGNNIDGEIDDGQHIAVNFASFDDLRAFADWAGLRPITELEYEKAGRGHLWPMANERAWGNTMQTNANTLINSGRNNEAASNVGANVSFGNAPAILGPMRCGSFASAATNRQQSGGSYYGVMELSGNLYESIVSAGIDVQRTFAGYMHGDGLLNAAGVANVTGWPASGGLRGGSWLSTTTNAQLSDRTSASLSVAGARASTYGIRLGRSIP
ncbi:MAG TPA: SUMF1/EgtB/PvdO family nonheme iron enzyme [Bacteroidales bacterium]|nr:SUMF1/EgtB/PvdO family nonheme iron enzyme [Bacteroidales bacterium]